MMDELARLVNLHYSPSVDTEWFSELERRICCLAHIINLGAQKLISTQSQAQHYDPYDPDAHIPSSDTRDEIGIVRAITVKVRCINFRC